MGPICQECWALIVRSRLNCTSRFGYSVLTTNLEGSYALIIVLVWWDRGFSFPTGGPASSGKTPATAAIGEGMNGIAFSCWVHFTPCRPQAIIGDGRISVPVIYRYRCALVYFLHYFTWFLHRNTWTWTERLLETSIWESYLISSKFRFAILGLVLMNEILINLVDFFYNWVKEGASHASKKL